MIDALVEVVHGALAMFALMLVIGAPASIVTGIVGEPRHAITDDWEDRLFGRGSR